MVMPSPVTEVPASSHYQDAMFLITLECVLNHFSHVQLFVTLWTVAYQAPPSMGFSRQGYWSGLPFPSPGRFFLLSLMGKCLASRQLNHVNFLPFLS